MTLPDHLDLMPALLKRLKFAWNYFVLGRQQSAQSCQKASWVEPPKLEAQLWFGSLLVADLHRMFPHQGTWFADCHFLLLQTQGELQARLLEYIAFCEDFDHRIAEGQNHEFDEFDRFNPIPNCESWSVRLTNGCLVPMEGRMWFTDGGVSWQHPETKPSTEAAACDFWVQNTKEHDL